VKESGFFSVAVMVVLAALSSYSQPKNESQPQTVLVPTVDSFINIHGSERRDLKICGKRFKGVSMADLGYSGVPNTHMILFVYGESEQARTIGVVDTNTCAVTEVPLTQSSFVGDFPLNPSPSKQILDYVEKFESNRVFVVHKSFDFFERSIIDLDRKTIKVVYVDSEEGRASLAWMNASPKANSFPQTRNVEGGDPAVPLSDANGTRRVFHATALQLGEAITNAFSGARYPGLMLFTANQFNLFSPKTKITNGLILTSRSSLNLGVHGAFTTVLLSSGKEVPYKADLQILWGSADRGQTTVTVRTLSAEVIDGQQADSAGHWSEHYRNVPPVRCAEENVLTAIAKQLSSDNYSGSRP
jgi:hypothetical protein